MPDIFNPNNAGAGGFLATSACGCTRGWVAYLDAEGRKDVEQWLHDGCTIRPLTKGEEIGRIVCAQHAKS